MGLTQRDTLEGHFCLNLMFLKVMKITFDVFDVFEGYEFDVFVNSFFICLF